MKSSTNAGHALRNLGNEPGEDAGRVVVRYNDGETLTISTNLITLTDVGLIIGTVDVPERFIPMGSVKDITNAD